MIPIVCCTIGSPSLAVFEASVAAYRSSEQHQLYLFAGQRTTFGEAYNAALTKMFSQYDEVIIANDDVVLTPSTMQVLMEDVERLRGDTLGFVAARSDFVRTWQNVRYQPENERLVRKAVVVSPIFAYLSKRAFEAAQFPPINYWSDDVMCLDLGRAGFTHYISRAYVHHAGSMSIGTNMDRFLREDAPWVRDNRSQYLSYLGL